MGQDHQTVAGSALNDLKQMAESEGVRKHLGAPRILPEGVEYTEPLRDERRAVARMLLRRAKSSTVKAVAEALRMAAADVIERTPGDTLLAIEESTP